MIRLISRKYQLDGVREDFFWKELDKITAGQSLNPLLGHTRPAYMQSKSIFVGRKSGNRFSILLYGGFSRFFRTAVLCKGHVSAKGHGIMIHCVYEYPFSSFIAFLLLALWIFIRYSPIPHISDTLAIAIGILLYGLIVVYNLLKIKREIARQLERIETKAKKELSHRRQ